MQSKLVLPYATPGEPITSGDILNNVAAVIVGAIVGAALVVGVGLWLFVSLGFNIDGSSLSSQSNFSIRPIIMGIITLLAIAGFIRLVRKTPRNWFLGGPLRRGGGHGGHGVDRGVEFFAVIGASGFGAGGRYNRCYNHEKRGVSIMVKLTVRKIGNSLGVILPRETINKLDVAEGDSLALTHGPDGCRITAYDPNFEKQMKIAEAGMRKYRNALRELAK